MGRKGSTSLMYEVVISLLFLGLFAVAMLNYINANANGDAFWSKFYATDISTSADVVNSGYGDIVLRYDNIKKQNQVSFLLADGKIAALPTTSLNKIAQGKQAQLLAEQEITSPDATMRYYGKTGEYIGEYYLPLPEFVLLRKIDHQFSITSADIVLKACPAAQGTPSTTVAIQGSDALVNAAKQSLALAGMSVDDASPVKITVQRNAGTENALMFAPTNKDGSAFVCVFAQQLAALNPAPFSTITPEQADTFTISITITTTGDAVVSDEQIGKALGRAMAVYAR